MEKLGCGRFSYIVALFCVAAAISSSAQTFRSLGLDGTDGQASYSAFVQGSDGNLYGTAIAGGEFLNGTVFKLSPAGRLTSLYGFCGVVNGEVCTDGANPIAGLVQGTDGSFYGTTTYGGTLIDTCNDACGTIFKMTPGGNLTTLYNFCGFPNCADGSTPEAALLLSAKGTFYGTTWEGGANGDGPSLRNH